jgi:hypothetical protein
MSFVASTPCLKLKVLSRSSFACYKASRVTKRSFVLRTFCRITVILSAASALIILLTTPVELCRLAHRLRVRARAFSVQRAPGRHRLRRVFARVAVIGHRCVDEGDLVEEVVQVDATSWRVDVVSRTTQQRWGSRAEQSSCELHSTLRRLSTSGTNSAHKSNFIGLAKLGHRWWVKIFD